MRRFVALLQCEKQKKSALSTAVRALLEWAGAVYHMSEYT
jgi:hypothetical protein